MVTVVSGGGGLDLNPWTPAYCFVSSSVFYRHILDVFYMSSPGIQMKSLPWRSSESNAEAFAASPVGVACGSAHAEDAQNTQHLSAPRRALKCQRLLVHGKGSGGFLAVVGA